MSDEWYGLKRRGYWFRPKAQGYTAHVDEAGMWKRREAEKFLKAEGVTMHLLPAQ